MNRERIARISVNEGSLEFEFGQESETFTDQFQLIIARNEITSYVGNDLPNGFHRMFATRHQTVSMTEQVHEDLNEIMIKVRVKDSKGLRVVFDVTVNDEEMFDDLDDFFTGFQSRSLMDEMIEGF